MTQALEFIGNHPLLFGALAAVVFMMIATETRRKIVGAKPVTAKETVALMNNQDAVVIDLRTDTEYKAGHIIGSLNIAEAGIAENPKLEKYKNKPIVIVCQSGARSQHASASLKKAGFNFLHYLKGGLFSWTQDNLPLEK